MQQKLEKSTALCYNILITYKREGIVVSEQNTKKSIEQELISLKKDLEDLKAFYKKNSSEKIIKRYQIQQNIMLAVTGVVIAAVTIPTAYNLFTYQNKLNELDSKIYTQYYLSLASESSSDEERIKNYTVAIEHDKSNPVAYYRRAELYNNSEEYDLALVDCERALDLDPYNKDALMLRADIYYKSGQYTQAIDCFKQLYGIDDDSNINDHLACSYYYLRDYENALLYLNLSRGDTVNYIVKNPEQENQYKIKVTCCLQLGYMRDALNALMVATCNYRNLNDIFITANLFLDVCNKRNDTDAAMIVNGKINELLSEANANIVAIRNNRRMPDYEYVWRDTELLNEIQWRIQEILDQYE